MRQKGAGSECAWPLGKVGIYHHPFPHLPPGLGAAWRRWLESGCDRDRLRVRQRFMLSRGSQKELGLLF